MRWLRLIGLCVILLSLFNFTAQPTSAQTDRVWLAEPMLLQEGKYPSEVDVAPLDASHVWAVSGNNILFYNGSQWTIQHTSGSFFSQIEMASTNRGWAFAYTDRSDESTFKFYEFNGSHWVERTNPKYFTYELFLAGDGTLLSLGWNGVYGSNQRAKIESYDGTAWHDITPFDRASYNFQVTPDHATWVWGNAYAGIVDPPQGYVFKYANGTFATMDLPPTEVIGSPVMDKDGLLSVQMINSNEGWASMIRTTGERQIYHYQNGLWNIATIPVLDALGGIANLWVYFVAGNQNEVIAQAGNREVCQSYRMLRLSGGTWSIISDPHARFYGDLIGTTGNGWFSTIECYEQSSPERYRYSNGTLTLDTAGSDIAPNRYYLLSDEVQWAVGDEMIMHYSVSSVPTAPVGATAGARYFPETGHNVRGVFRTFYESHGLDFGEPGISASESLALFGYPLTEEFQELNPDTGEYLTVQYFERVRIEYHPNNPDPFKVLLGRLGAVRYVQVYGYINDGDPNEPIPAGCERFAINNHDLCPPFRDYWNSVGSVQIFGMPIANALQEKSYTDGNTYLTLWTERERLEHHLEFAGTRYEILLGLLAKEDLRMRGFID